MRLGRRRFLAGLLGTAAVGSARAQQAAMPVVGFLGDGSPETWTTRVDGVRRGLAELGFVEWRNVTLEYRWARGNYALLPGLAADLVQRQVSVIVSAGSEKVTRAAKAATTTIPIVATMAGDPVARGLVASVNRPGGNLTVVSLFTSSDNALVTKRMELVHELVPKVTIVGWLADANILDYEAQLRDLQRSAHAIGLETKVATAAREPDIETAVTSLVRDGAGAILQTGPLFFAHRPLLVSLAARAAVPVLYEWRDFVDDGGLMSYGTVLAEIYRQAGVYAGRILKGEKVGDLPVVQQSKFELVINLKTAKALGLTLPPLLVARADAVIE
jgi:putative ABC transport system substrate-binding protein